MMVSDPFLLPSPSPYVPSAMKDKPPPPAAPAMVVRARILQAEGIVAPSVPKELALLLYPHTAGWLPPVLLACGRAVSAPARTGHDERGSGTALGGARDAADDFIRARRGSTSGRHGGSSDASSDCGSRGDRRGACQSSSSDTSQAEAAAEWRVAVIRFVEHAPAKVEPPSGGRPAVAVHHLECDAAALACAEQGQPEAARWIVAYAAVREFERLRGVKAEHNSTTVQVRGCSGLGWPKRLWRAVLAGCTSHSVCPFTLSTLCWEALYRTCFCDRNAIIPKPTCSLNRPAH